MGMLQTCGAKDFGECFNGMPVEICDALGFVGHNKRALAQRILGGNAHGATVRMAALRLDAANGKHEAAGGIAPIGTQRHGACDIERADDLACATDLDALTQVQTDQRVVHQQQTFLHRRAHVIGELHRCRTGAALTAIDHDEVGRDAGFEHGLGECEPLPGVPDAQLEAHRFAA
jgi:hypothetical protein